MMPLAVFSNLFGPDMLVIFLIVLLLFGAKKLPELARGLGQSLNEFRKAREDFEGELRAGQQDVQAREAGNRQPHAPAAVPATPQATLPYNPPAAPAQDQALQQQIADLQQKLRLAEEQSKNTPSSVG